MPADPSAVEAWLTAWLPTQRWFADKSRPIATCRVVQNHDIDETVSVSIVRTTFSDGGDSDYVVPLHPSPLSDATGSAAFLEWLGRLASGTAAWPGVVARRQLLDSDIDLTELDGRLLGIEQSNTSIRYGSRWVVKLNRRMSYGPSPEVELSPLLHRWAGPACAPRTAAALSVTTDRGAATVALQSDFVTNMGDGWSFVLAALRVEAAAGDRLDRTGGSLREVTAVAELTADLHLALNGDPWTRELAAERIDGGTADTWERAAGDALRETLLLLESARPTLTGRSRELAGLVSGATPTIHHQVAGFRALAGSKRTRTHGDYHLGQVLRRPDGRYVAIDFDGEPQRPLAERREKYSPLRDVAGMMRSLAYAAGTVQAESADVTDEAWVRAWERSARETFLAGYLDRLSAAGPALLPIDPERVRQALAALELEKALYEVGYELNNRPDWVWIPLTQLVRMG